MVDAYSPTTLGRSWMAGRYSWPNHSPGVRTKAKLEGAISSGPNPPPPTSVRRYCVKCCWIQRWLRLILVERKKEIVGMQYITTRLKIIYNKGRRRSPTVDEECLQQMIFNRVVM